MHAASSEAEDPLKLDFEANRYGPSSHKLMHLLDKLDGSYLQCDKRLADASPFDTIWLDESKKTKLGDFLSQLDQSAYVQILKQTAELIDGFQSPLGLEVLSTVDWLITEQSVDPSIEGIRQGLKKWPVGDGAGERKQRLFSDRMLKVSLERLQAVGFA